MTATTPSPSAGVPLDLERIQREYTRCAEDFTYYLRTYVYVQERTTQQTVRWEWWPDVHDSGVQLLLTERRIVVLKARQVSWSWLMAAYGSWTALFHENAGVLVLSKGQGDSNQFVDKVKFILDHLPPWMQLPRKVDNTSVIEFEVMGSRIEALPATEEAGRGATASLIIVDEAAFHPYAAVNYVAYKPAIDAGGQLIIVSTANGSGNFFHQMYVQARAGASGFRAAFYSWRTRPGRDDAWLEAQRLGLRAAGEERKLAQEYPDYDDEAFLVSGNLRFDRDALKVHREEAEQRRPLPAKVVLAALEAVSGVGGNNVLAALLQSGQLKVWQLPQPGIGYVVGSDVAEGLANGDYSCSVGLAARTREHAWTLHGHWEPGTFAQLTAVLAWWYNTALWGIERNNHGHAVLMAADQRMRYPRLYWHDDPVQQTDRQRYGSGSSGPVRPARRLGWPTTSGTKPGLIDDLAEAILTFGLRSWDTGFWGECQTYIVNERGGTEAGVGSYDDRVMAMGIAVRMAEQPGAGTARALVLNGQGGSGGMTPRRGSGSQYRWNWG